MLQSFHYFISLSSKFSTALKNNKTSLMSTIKTVLIDLNGTLHIEDEAIPGTADALNRLRETHVNIKFVTNTTTHSRKDIFEKLKNLGIDVEEEEIYTSILATRNFLINEHLKPIFLLDESSLKDFPGLSSFDGEPDSVVIGLSSEKLNRPNLNKALRIILGGGTLVATHQGKYYKRKDGLALGPGPFVKALEYATGSKAVVLGKPNTEFYKGALDKVTPEQAVMIGDDVKDDIFGAQLVGIRGYLVKTGKYMQGDENKINPPPYKVVESFAAAVDDIISSLLKKD